jgi:YidC/Oxa1 family membrane protein insertase
VLNWLYTAISWILLRWHDVWSFLSGREFLNTNWDWILAIIFLVITVRIILFPVFVKQIKSQRAMQALQPQVKELQQKHKGDRETLQKELMELYRKEKANPLMGCLPIFLQIPVFISLFWILRRLDPLQTLNTELYGWTDEQFRSASLAELFGAPIASQFFDDNFDRFASLDASLLTTRIVTGVLVIIMMVTTHLTAKQMILKTGWSTDQTQLMMQRLMVWGFPAMLLFSGAFFPIGVIIYWVVQNLFSLAQQQWVLRKYPPPPSAKDTAAATNGAKPSGARAGGKPAAKQQPAKGKGKKDAPVQDERPAVDGKQLAPRPGAKPVRAKGAGGSQGAQGGGRNQGAKGGGAPGASQRAPSQLDKTQAQNIPPKRKSSTPRKG